ADYLSRHGAPATPQDLHHHACINWRLEADGRPYRWEFERRRERLEIAVTGPLVTNDAGLGLSAALQGLGIAYAFDQESVATLLADGRLVQVLADWSITRPGLFLYHPSRRHMPAPLRAFIDCLLDRDQPSPAA
ncbi:MAG: LysR family transcriptional regulator, partial [Pseudacidovorax sp.]|nr:LysR family transcriptional regulator [Pseudacidovorax sp.]